MKVFLCEPNIPVRASRFEPLGLCSISAFLKSKGHQAVVYQQFGQPDEQVAKQILDFAPEVVGFSCIDVNSPGALRIAAAVKKARPEIITLFGGEHPTARPELVQNPVVDFVAIGEGELTALELLQQLQGEKNFASIRGLAFSRDGKLVVTDARDRIEDLGALPAPDRDILGKTQYQYFGLTPSDLGIPAGQLRVAATYLSRGCTHNCHFCTTPKVWGRRWIHRPVDDVISELADLEKSGINFVYFQDENFLTDLKVASEFCEKKLSANIALPFSIISRVTHLDERTIDLLYRAGLRHVGVGIESVRETTLDKIQKGLDLPKTREKISLLKNRGVSICGLFMIGYPWETAEMIRGYGPLIRRLGVDSIKIQFLTPFAGTELYLQAKAEGTILSYDPQDQSTERPTLKSTHLSTEQLLKLRTGLYRGFYLSPAFLLKIFRQVLARPALIRDYSARLYWFFRKTGTAR